MLLYRRKWSWSYKVIKIFSSLKIFFSLYVSDFKFDNPKFDNPNDDEINPMSISINFAIVDGFFVIDIADIDNVKRKLLILDIIIESSFYQIRHEKFNIYSFIDFRGFINSYVVILKSRMPKTQRIFTILSSSW
jgi:hypothetical protein